MMDSDLQFFFTDKYLPDTGNANEPTSIKPVFENFMLGTFFCYLPQDNQLFHMPEIFFAFCTNLDTVGERFEMCNNNER
jgi:hypothetical protein